MIPVFSHLHFSVILNFDIWNCHIFSHINSSYSASVFEHLPALHQDSPLLLNIINHYSLIIIRIPLKYYLVNIRCLKIH